MRLQDKVAIVTGGGKGLGAAISLTLAREGAHISIGDVNLSDATRVANTVKAMGRNAIAIKADVSKESDVQAMVAQTIDALGTIDVLVNNAGIIYVGPVAEMPEEAWDRVLDVNLKSAFFLVKFLEDVGYAGSRHFDAHAYRTEDYEGVKDFARGCMRTYLILKEKAALFNADPEIQGLLAEINTDDGSTSAFEGAYSPQKAAALKAATFDRAALAARGLAYERLDQLTVELLMGVR